MFAKTVLTDEERAVDGHLGYPRGYAKLCRHAYIQMQGLITPYTEGPPQRFQPYAPLEEELNKLKEFEKLFPYVADEERDPANARRHAEQLWQQLDHLGNAGFDPAKFRVDMYGNVVYWQADPGSPLAWEVDHWFPHSRGGKTVVSNLRIVQWQVNQKKGTKLEFLVPWWDLQIGISVNQFLSVFSSRNADFRQRAFALFFQAGENEQLDDKLAVESHSWPQHFRERKHRVGLAAAAIVKVQKALDDTLRVVNGNGITAQKQTSQVVGTGTPGRRRWTIDEEEALKRAVQKFGPGNWKDIKEFEPVLVNRSTVQIKDKYRLMKGEWKVDKENTGDRSWPAVVTSIQREERLKQAREAEKKQKQEELDRLEEDLKQLKDHNEKEKSVLEELEQTLASERKRVEKQRKWSDTQSQYRLCLEKMIRDTMHQCVVYKEQARLNQAACNALVARLESLKVACDAAEMDFMKRVKQRESLEAMVRPKIIKRTRNDGHLDVSNCIRSNQTTGVMQINRKKPERLRLFDIDSEQSKSLDTSSYAEKDEDEEEDENNKDTSNEAIGEEKEEDHDEETEVCVSPYSTAVNDSCCATADQFVTQQNLEDKEELGPEGLCSPTDSAASSGMKRKTLGTTEMEMFLFDDDVIGQEEHEGRKQDEEQGFMTDISEADDVHIGGKDTERSCKDDDEQVDELLRDPLEMKGRVDAAMADAVGDEDEDERIKRIGKCNVDKWLKMLLLHPGDGVDAAAETMETCVSNKATPNYSPVREGNGSDDADDVALQNSPLAMTQFPRQEQHEGDVSLLGGLLKKLSLKHGQGEEEENRHGCTEGGREKKAVKKETEDKQRTATMLSPWRRRASTSPLFKRAFSVRDGHGTCKKPNRDEFNEAAAERGSEGHEQKEDDSEVAFQIACESEFVEKMRARREREQRLQRYRRLGIPPRLQDLLAESSSSLPSPSQQASTTTTTSTTVVQNPDSMLHEAEAEKEQKQEDNNDDVQQIWLPEVKQWEVWYQGRPRRRHRQRASNSSSPKRQSLVAGRSLSTSPHWAQRSGIEKNFTAAAEVEVQVERRHCGNRNGGAKRSILQQADSITERSCNDEVWT